jgi:GDP-L-fucose synthase
MFAPDVQMTINLLDTCSKSRTLDRLLLTSSTCIYKRGCQVPFREDDGFLDDPEPTAMGYGWAKRVAEKAALLYKNQFSLKTAIVRLENVYGPRDNFSVNQSHVIPSLIRRALDANEKFVVWGNGQQSRSFLYVEDAADAMLTALEKYAENDPINVGTDEETTIAKLAETILEILGKNHIQLSFDLSKPTGQIRKATSIEKMTAKLGFVPKYNIRDGLKKTISWVKSNPDVLTITV